MSVSHKYKTFDQLLNEVKVDFNTQSLENMIDPGQLIKVAQRVNYDLGLRINRTKQVILDIEHNKARLPYNFYTLNYAFVCDEFTIEQNLPSGTYVESVGVDYVPHPTDKELCSSNGEVCLFSNCDGNNQYKLVQKTNSSSKSYRVYNTFYPLRISKINDKLCDCPNAQVQSPNLAEIKDGFIKTSFKTGKVYMSYQGAMEDTDGNLLVLDHPYCNEYYEYALKERILENMLFSGEPVSNQLQYIQQKLRAARNNALGFVNTPDFEEMRKLKEVNRKAQYHNYYNMFKSYPTIR